MADEENVRNGHRLGNARALLDEQLGMERPRKKKKSCNVDSNPMALLDDMASERAEQLGEGKQDGGSDQILADRSRKEKKSWRAMGGANANARPTPLLPHVRLEEEDEDESLSQEY